MNRSAVRFHVNEEEDRLSTSGMMKADGSRIEGGSQALAKRTGFSEAEPSPSFSRLRCHWTGMTASHRAVRGARGDDSSAKSVWVERCTSPVDLVPAGSMSFQSLTLAVVPIPGGGVARFALGDCRGLYPRHVRSHAPSGDRHVVLFQLESTAYGTTLWHGGQGS